MEPFASLPGEPRTPDDAAGFLEFALLVLREHAKELRSRGILHAFIFGSLARGEGDADSDLDVVVDARSGVGTLDIIEIEELLARPAGRRVEIVSKRGLHAARHAEILRDMVQAF